MKILRLILVIILMILIGWTFVYIQAGISVIEGWGAASQLSVMTPVKFGLMKFSPFIALDILGIELCSIKIHKTSTTMNESKS